MGNPVDTSCSRKKYTAYINIPWLPMDASRIGIFRLLLYVTDQNKKSAFIIRVPRGYENDIPSEILIAGSDKGFYMELSYPMDEWGWEHPLYLVSDALSSAEAMEVLSKILAELTDSTPRYFPWICG